MSKQSSVNWLINELHIKMNGGYSKFSYNHMFDKARAMHREEIEEAWSNGDVRQGNNQHVNNAVEYYNNTFEK